MNLIKRSFKPLTHPHVEVLILGSLPGDASLAKAHEELKLVVFNGKKAEKLYEKFFQRIETIRYLTLPSTSPANRKFNFDQMIEEWSKIKGETG